MAGRADQGVERTAVCRDELQLDPQTVLRAHIGELRSNMLGLDDLDGTKPDKATLRDYRALFAQKWRERVE